MQQALALLTAASTRAIRAASPTQATTAVQAVRRAGRYSPGRTACLEESLATVLLLATRRLGVTWCHGIASDPIRLHAWVQTMDGADVAEPASTRAYEKAGFQHVGAVRQAGYWLGTVCDEILMDALATDFTDPSAITASLERRVPQPAGQGDGPARDRS